MTDSAVPRARRWDVLVAVVCFGVGSILYSGLPVSLPAVPFLPVAGFPSLVLLAVMCVGQVFRTTYPVPGLLVGLVAAVIDVALGLSLPVLLVLTDLLYCATLYGSRRTSRVIMVLTGTLVLTTAVVSMSFADDWRRGVLTILQVCPIPLIPVWWAVNVRTQREIAESERARADDVARIAELDRQAAVGAERSRMARDLHDVIAGQLSAIAIQTEALLSTVDDMPERARTVLKSVRHNSVASLTEMRAMIGLLRSDDTESMERTAPARLRDLDPLIDSARAAGLRVRVESTVDGELPAAVDLSAYRIVQEALTNAVKHAPGAAASVSVRGCEGTLVLEVVNELTGSSSGTGGGTGLATMAERAQAVGGTLVSAGRHDDRWLVRAELPVGEEKA
ncbi:sensor histidine kinase [Herbihabitans rhizosphaerae]|uniref:sensor histidine kinase n=1 Tax=Herbihabitans rhizosphaerae TaxID=1872711 RepID=UPI003BF78C90